MGKNWIGTHRFSRESALVAILLLGSSQSSFQLRLLDPQVARAVVAFDRAAWYAANARLVAGALSSTRALTVTLREARGDLREVLEPRRALRQVPLEPSHRRFFVLRCAALGVEMAGLSASRYARTSQRPLRRCIRSAPVKSFVCPHRNAAPSNGLPLRTHDNQRYVKLIDSRAESHHPASTR